MKKGDLVRFCQEQWKRERDSDCGLWHWKMGLLIEYHTWEKVATILCEGKTYRVRAENVQKAGRKDIELWKETRGED